MAVGNVGVDMAVVLQTAADIRENKSTMKSNLGAISDAVSNLRSSWQSEAANELSAISSKMNARFGELEKSVEAFAAFLDQVAANYKKTEAEAVSAQQRISSQFDG